MALAEYVSSEATWCIFQHTITKAISEMPRRKLFPSSEKISQIPWAECLISGWELSS